MLVQLFGNYFVTILSFTGSAFINISSSGLMLLTLHTTVHLYLYSTHLLVIPPKTLQPTDGQHVSPNKRAQSVGMAMLTAQMETIYITWLDKSSSDSRCTDVRTLCPL